MLLQLPSLSEVPAADGVVQSPRPQLGAVVGDVDAARSVCVALELPETTQEQKIKSAKEQKAFPNSNNERVLCWWSCYIPKTQ